MRILIFTMIYTVVGVSVFAAMVAKLAISTIGTLRRGPAEEENPTTKM